MLALDQELYDYVLISRPQRSCKTSFAISPIFVMKRLRPSLPPLAPFYRLPATKGSELMAREGTKGLLDRWCFRTGQEENEGTGAPGLGKPKKLSRPETPKDKQLRPKHSPNTSEFRTGAQHLHPHRQYRGMWGQ